MLSGATSDRSETIQLKYRAQLIYALIVPLITTPEEKHIPAEKEIGGYDGKFTSIRVCEINGEERVIEGTYEIRVSGELSGTATGTMTFTGLNERGTFSDLGVGYLDSGDVLSAKGQGVYWSGSKGQWETRGAWMLGDQMIVGEGQITMDDGIFSLKGRIRELT